MAYSDFANPSDFSTFRLLVEKKPLYINAHYLAQVSPYFANLCFNAKFVEKDNTKAELVDESYEDMLEFLQCIMVTSTNMPRPVTGKNCSLLLRLADKFEVAPLKSACESCIQNNLPITLSDEEALHLLKTATSHNVKKCTLVPLISRCAKIDYKMLKEHSMHRHGAISTALFAANGRTGDEARSPGHIFRCTKNGDYRMNYGCCSACRRQDMATHLPCCIKCEKCFCPEHEAGKCDMKDKMINMNVGIDVGMLGAPVDVDLLADFKEIQ